MAKAQANTKTFSKPAKSSKEKEEIEVKQVEQEDEEQEDEDEEDEDEDEDDTVTSDDDDDDGSTALATRKSITAKDIRKQAVAFTDEDVENIVGAVGLQDKAFFKFPEGKTRIRITPGLVGEKTLYVISAHFTTKGETQRSYPCARVMLGERCYHCENGEESPSKTGMAIAKIEGQGNSPSIVRFRGDALHGLKDEIADNADIFDLDNGFDLIVTRTGTNKNTKWRIKVVKNASAAFASDDEMTAFYNMRPMSKLMDAITVMDYKKTKRAMEAADSNFS